MGIRKIVESGPPVDKVSIESIEKKLGAKLPNTYREFLLTHNGGRPEPCSFSRNVVVTHFYGVLPKAKNYDLLEENKVMRQWLPKGMIAIADDPFGNAICLTLKGKNRGKLYLWDHEGAPERVDIRAKYPGIIFDEDDPDNSNPRAPVKDDWPGHPDLTLVANSFTEFIDGFRDIDTDEPKVKRKRPK